MQLEILKPRDVPLGGLRAMTVRRTLPHRDRSFVGAWCFVDHYGPNTVGVDAPPMDVAPHPHTGLQTVSWLFAGEIEHRDSGGVHAMVLPGEVNLMTAGRGISHSEVSTPGTSTLHGVQLWVALPAAAREVAPAFANYAAPAVAVGDDAGTARVFLGELAGVSSSPVVTHTPLLGAELVLAAGRRLTLRLDESFEHGFLIDDGDVRIDGELVPVGALACLDAGDSAVTLSCSTAARIVLLGGPPFDEELVMWWNFIGSNHDDIARSRAEWDAGSARFGQVTGYVGEVDRIPAPALPGVRLKPRRRRRAAGEDA